jgi:hypothetical protein
MKKITSMQKTQFDFDLDELLHPAQAFEHPRHVVADPDLTLCRATIKVRQQRQSG